MEEATQELRTEAIQMPNDFAVVAAFFGIGKDWNV
jgi:hypothetical protein